MLIQRLATLAGISGVVASVCAAGALSGACAAQGGGTDVGGGATGSNTSGTGTTGASGSGSGTSTSGTYSGSAATGTATSGTATSGTGTTGTGVTGTATTGTATGAAGTATTGTSTGSTTGTGATGTATTGTTTGTATSGTATSGTATGTCAVTSVGGLPLTSNFLSTAAGNPALGGYAFSYDDKLGSLTCISTAAFCGSGTIAAQNPPLYTIYGGGIGVNLNQPMATTATSPPIGMTAATGSGIKYAVSSVPKLGLRIAIDQAGVDYCATAPGASGTIPWATFNTKCFDTPADGVALTGAPTSATHIQFQVPSGMAPGSFDFCVTAVSFAP